MPPIAQRRILSIQYLRAIAALAVVAHHTEWTHTTLGSGGVDLFFLISGFVMVHVSGREAEPRSFLSARIVRLVPLYWVLTIASAIWFQASTGHLLSSLMFWPRAARLGEDLPVIPQGWTLDFEMFFYLVFAGVLLAPARLRIWLLTAVLAAVVLFGLLVRPEQPALATFTNPILLEFLAGAWIRVMFGAGPALRPAAAAGLLAAGAGLYLLQAPLPTPDAWRVLLWGGPCALILTGAVALELSGWVRSIRPLRLLGDASYSIYLIQFFVLAPVVPLVKPLPGPMAIGLVVAACAAVGVAVHWLLERPLQRFFRRLLRPRPAIVRVPAG